MTLTNQDLNQVRIVVKEEMYYLKEEVKELKENIKQLPTRNELLDTMSELMGEVKNEREENTILDGRTSDHEVRIAKLEKIHPRGQHASI